MTIQRKTIVNPVKFGAELRDRRKRIGKTLQAIAEITSINVGQLSRFERGQMKRMTPNLQNLIINLQILESTAPHPHPSDVIDRFTAIFQRSERHALAATALVDALEQLM